LQTIVCIADGLTLASWRTSPVVAYGREWVRRQVAAFNLAQLLERRMIMATSKKSSAKKTAAKSGAKRGPTQGLMKPVQPSAALAVIVGPKPLPRTEITKRLWAYIKDHGLQDAQNKRLIHADATLEPVLGGKPQVSMFELAKLVSQHVQ
jgi:upstream activation factor subunit UAF30